MLLVRCTQNHFIISHSQLCFLGLLLVLASNAAATPLLLSRLSLLHGLILRDFDVLGLDALEDLGGLGGKLALGADAVTVLPEEEGEGKAGHSQEGGDGAGPLVAEIVVHVGGEERECRTKERSKDRVGGQNRGGKDDICALLVYCLSAIGGALNDLQESMR